MNLGWIKPVRSRNELSGTKLLFGERPPKIVASSSLKVAKFISKGAFRLGNGKIKIIRPNTQPKYRLKLCNFSEQLRVQVPEQVQAAEESDLLVKWAVVLTQVCRVWVGWVQRLLSPVTIKRLLL